MQNHPFFKRIDWGLLAAGLIPPPWVPETSINAAAQDMIGAFDDASKRVVLDDEDQARYTGWEITNKQSFQQEMVDFLVYSEAHGRVEADPTVATCCTIA